MKPASFLIVLALMLGLVGCSSPEGGDGGKETTAAEAKQKIDSKMSKAEQTELSANVKAWDPKKDKK